MASALPSSRTSAWAKGGGSRSKQAAAAGRMSAPQCREKEAESRTTAFPLDRRKAERCVLQRASVVGNRPVDRCGQVAAHSGLMHARYRHIVRPMPSPLLVDPALFDPAAVSDETRALNDDIARPLDAEPAGLTIPQIRERRIQGIGAFPPSPKSPRAETVAIDGPAGRVELRVIATKEPPRGIFFHIHGGGWSIGAPDQNDPLLERMADGAGLACVSVKYRLGPEHPYPAGPDDCEAAALWVVREGGKSFCT